MVLSRRSLKGSLCSPQTPLPLNPKKIKVFKDFIPLLSPAWKRGDKNDHMGTIVAE
jgi:hypothetical protein